jgi:hypothetical protein
MRRAAEAGGRPDDPLNFGRAVAAKALGEQPYRFCQGCGTRVEITVADQYDFRRPWSCPSCAPKLAQEDFLNVLRRIRYLERRTTKQLCAFDLQMEVQRLDLEEIADPELAKQRPERFDAAMDELKRVHGEQDGQQSPPEVS